MRDERAVKRLSNLVKHEVDFASVEVFDWTTAQVLALPGRPEPRLAAYGLIAGRLHGLVYTVEIRSVRVISAGQTGGRSGSGET